MKNFRQYCREKSNASTTHKRLPYALLLCEKTETPTDPQFTETRRIRMTLEDFADAISLLNAQKSDVERMVEVRFDCPDPYSILVTFFPQETESASEQDETVEG